MNVPGSNIFKMAMTALGSQKITYFKYLRRSTNAIALDVSEFADGVIIYGSFQPVPRSKYEMYGLDLQRSYFTFYASRNVIDLARDVAGDQLEFNCKRFQCISANDWFEIDGWDGVLCVRI